MLSGCGVGPSYHRLFRSMASRGAPGKMHQEMFRRNFQPWAQPDYDGPSPSVRVLGRPPAVTP